jgi:putative membrane protein
MGRRVKTLVICVDRDNDIGEKAGLEAPIIGREASLSAATRLALADSEDSDINAIFEAIRIYERLNAEGEEAEVVLVAGDKNVGIASDRKIGEELDSVLTRTGAGSVILVSDGAEDEWIIPLIQSRVRIDSVRRVVVRQSEPLESTFYVVKKLFDDPKFSRTFLLPLGLFLFMIALSLLFGFSKLAMGLVLGFIGIYMLLKGLGRENDMITFFENVKQSLYSGKISFVMYICAIVLLLAGSFQGIMEIPPEKNDGVLVDVMYYLKGAIWWYIGAALAPLVGKMMNMLIESEKIVRHWAILFSVIASGLVLWGGSNCIIWLNEGEFAKGYLYLFFSILGALVISFIGVKISWYMKSTIKVKREKQG